MLLKLSHIFHNEEVKMIIKIVIFQTSLVVQWLRVRMLMQGPWVWPWSGKPTCQGAPKPVDHGSWALTQNSCPSTGEATAARSLSTAAGVAPLLAARGSPGAATETQHSPAFFYNSHFSSKIDNSYAFIKMFIQKNLDVILNIGQKKV